MTIEDRTRKRVERSYGSRITSDRACCGDAIPQVSGTGAGYSATQLAALPEEVVGTSFGCGNPLAASGIERGQSVLDLGCGGGIDLLLAADRVGSEGHVIGVDMTEAMVARAIGAIEQAGLDNTEVRQGLIEELPVEDASVDWVISNCVINLSPEKDRVFSEIARVLRPGGRFSISDIVVEDLPWWIRRSGRLHCACVAGAISESAYVEGLDAAGLTEVEVVDRQVYDSAQLRHLVESEAATVRVPGWVRRLAGGYASRFAGRIWSARFSGARPA